MISIKKIYHSFILSVFFFALISCSNSKAEKAMQYNDQMIDQQIVIIDAIDSLEVSFNNYQIDRMEVCYSNLQKEIRNGILLVDNIEAYEGDESLKNGTKALFLAYKRLSDSEFPVIINLLSMPDSVFTDEDQQRLFDQQSKINTITKEAHNKFLEVQAKFGKTHNLIFTNK